MGNLFGLGKRDSIHDAVRTGNSQKMMEIISKRPDRVNEKDDFGTTPLHIAVEKGNIPIIKQLIQKGAEVNAKDNDGRTPLDFLAMRPNEEIEELLRQYGAK